mgnify:FL=1
MKKDRRFRLEWYLYSRMHLCRLTTQKSDGLQVEQPDVILLDFADNDWHITLDGAVKMCAAYLDALLIPIHWGSVDAPDFSTFNGNPMELAARIVNPERLHVLLPGEKFEM